MTELMSNTTGLPTHRTVEAGISVNTSDWTTRTGGGWLGLPADYYKERWYAAYTIANHEKRVAGQLVVRDVEHFLPTYTSMRRWKDRRVTLQLPLFPGYVFVHMALRNRLQVLQIPGVARLVGFDAMPIPLDDEEVLKLQRALSTGLHAEPHPFLTMGRRVRIIAGPLAGHEGILIRRKGNLHVVLSIDLIQRSILLQIDAASLGPLI